MTSTLSRRGFVSTIAACLPGALFSDAGSLFAGDHNSVRDERLFSISLAQWSLHRALNADELDARDFAKTARRDFGIDAVEYVNTFFKHNAEDRAYLRELKSRAADHGVRSLLIMIDDEGAIGDPDEFGRTRAIENHYKWVEAARYLGCHSIRVNAHSRGTPAVQHELVVDGLRRLTEFAAERSVNVAVENHGGLSSDGAWLVKVIKAVDHPRCGTLPDFGNFQIARGVTYDRYLGVAEMMPYAKAVSAKSNDFDDLGRERNTDFTRMIQIVLDAGYRGYIGIEYEGEKLSEREGILTTKRLLERVRSELAPRYLP